MGARKERREALGQLMVSLEEGVWPGIDLVLRALRHEDSDSLYHPILNPYNDDLCDRCGRPVANGSGLYFGDDEIDQDRLCEHCYAEATGEPVEHVAPQRLANSIRESFGEGSTEGNAGATD